jgi:hypothetical protein
LRKADLPDFYAPYSFQLLARPQAFLLLQGQQIECRFGDRAQVRTPAPSSLILGEPKWSASLTSLSSPRKAAVLSRKSPVLSMT